MKEERRLVWRVLRNWTEIAHGGRFPCREEIDPWLRGEDGANCLLITVEWSIELIKAARCIWANAGQDAFDPWLARLEDLDEVCRISRSNRLIAWSVRLAARSRATATKVACRRWRS